MAKKNGSIFLFNKDKEICDQKEGREYYKNYLSTHFENLVILTGAGSSVGIGEGEKKGKTRSELWESVKIKVTENKLKEFCQKVKYKYPSEKEIGDIEALLSKADRAKEYIENIDKTIKDIKQQIKEDCSLKLPNNSCHQLFLQKITSRKLCSPRVKLFTLNYDTLFEQASYNNGITLIDGFDYSNKRTFNGTYFDYDFVIRENSRIEKEENYVTRVMQMYKLHGSLDWKKDNDKIIKCDEYDNQDPLIIYPNTEKYEISYEQPFFEMMMRFQQALRKENVMLIVIGFSFYDKHIANIIKETLKSNHSFRAMVVTKDINNVTDYEELKQNISKGNMILIDETFEEFSKNYPYPKIYQSDYLIENIEQEEGNKNEE